MEINEIFSENLKRIMAEKHYRNTDIVNGMGVSKQIVSAWVNGNRVPRMKMLDRLCEFLGCRRSDLLEKEKEPDEIASDPQTEIIIKMFSRLPVEKQRQAFDYILSLFADTQ